MLPKLDRMDRLNHLRRLPIRLPGGRKVLALVMCLVLWRGPIPVPHLHGSHVSSPAPEFVQHLESFHHRDALPRAEEWHVHFVLPWSKTSDGDQDNPLCPTVPAPLLTDSPGSILDFRGPTDFVMNAPLLLEFVGETLRIPSAPCPAIAAVRRTTSFLGSLFDCAPPCAVIAVALC